MEKKERLEKLKKRNGELEPVVFKGAQKSEELKAYMDTIKAESDEWYANQKEIDTLEWELKTPAEKEYITEQRKLMKLKREGKL